MNRDASIFVAGHRGLVGSAITRELQKQGFQNLILRTRDELDLTIQGDVADFFATEQPEYVFLAAARVGGILANATYPADFIATNLNIQTNVVDAAYRNGTKKLCFFGSSCIYPKHAPQPMSEDALLTGPLEPTNESYAIAKIAGIMMCRAYRKQYGFNAIAVMPTNLYGPGDNFHPETSHVLPALIQKLDNAKRTNAASVTLWGSGTPRREFLYVDDLAQAVCFLMASYDSAEIINIGVGKDIAIAQLANLVRNVVGFEGQIEFDASKPDGMPRKLMDVSKLNNFGWSATTSLADGIRATYRWYLENLERENDAR
jgi:GDP-L-fucose synthase